VKGFETPEVRKKLAHVMVWERVAHPVTQSELMSRYVIEARIEKYLEKIAERLSKKISARSQPR